MKTSQLIALTLLVGIAIGAAIFFILGLPKVVGVLSGANIQFVALAAAAQLVSVLAIFGRWSASVDFARIRVSSARLLLASLAGIAFANITPSSRMGGEPVRAYFLRRNARTHTGDALATVIVERVFDGVTFAFISLIVLVLAFIFWHLQWWVVLLMFVSFILSSAFLGFAIYLSYNRKAALGMMFWLLDRFRRFVGKEQAIRRVQKSIMRNVANYNRNAKRMLASRALWAKGVALSLLNWFFEVLRAYLILLALGAQNPSFLVVAAAIVIAALGGSLPLLPGGLGVMEGTMIIILSSAGITPALAGAATILDRLISYWGLTFVGLGSAYYLGFKSGNVPANK
ncbi:flippase-like domain-containing protein [Candidatus Micrarchaeota archaeon]|nr:flippase-like domain-containing protein [Candidatus Micrarchaeota archaeon]